MRRRGGIALLFFLLAAAVPAGPAWGEIPAPAWLPGFPLRAGDSVLMVWLPVPHATQYRLLRKTGDGPFRELYKGAATNYNDTGVDPLLTVEYRVHAVIGTTEGPASPAAVLRGVKPLPAPTVTGALSTADAVTIRWSPPPDAAFSNVYRAEAEGGPFSLVESVQFDTFTDRKVVRGKTYFYRVTAVDATNRESVPSAVATARLSTETSSAKESAVYRKLVSRGEFQGEEYYRLVQPSSAGFTRDGRLYVVERGGIQFFDLDGEFVRRIRFDPLWGLAGDAAVDRDGNILLTFYADGVVRKVDGEGQLLAEIRYDIDQEKAPRRAPPTDNAAPSDAPSAERPNPCHPNSVAVDGDGFYWIVDGPRAQVVKTDASGRIFAVLGRPPDTYRREERKPSDLPAVKRIYFNPVDGRLYAVLGVSVEIKVIDPATATVVRTFGGIGTTPGKLQLIGGLAFRRNGAVLVLDGLSRLVKEYDRNGAYVASYADVFERRKVRLSANVPTDVAFREELNRFFLTSMLGGRVYKYDVAK